MGLHGECLPGGVGTDVTAGGKRALSGGSLGEFPKRGANDLIWDQALCLPFLNRAGWRWGGIPRGGAVTFWWVSKEKIGFP